MLDDQARKEVRSLQLRIGLAAVVGMVAAGAVMLLVGGDQRVSSGILVIPWIVAALLGIQGAYQRGWNAATTRRRSTPTDD